MAVTATVSPAKYILLSMAIGKQKAVFRFIYSEKCIYCLLGELAYGSLQSET